MKISLGSDGVGVSERDDDDEPWGVDERDQRVGSWFKMLSKYACLSSLRHMPSLMTRIVRLRRSSRSSRRGTGPGLRLQVSYAELNMFGLVLRRRVPYPENISEHGA